MRREKGSIVSPDGRRQYREDQPESLLVYATPEPEDVDDEREIERNSLALTVGQDEAVGYENVSAYYACAKRHNSERREDLKLAFDMGLSIRAAARFAQCSRNTARLYYRKWHIAATCQCGKPSTHRGWCRWRVLGSVRRKAFLARWGRVVSEEQGDL